MTLHKKDTALYAAPTTVTLLFTPTQHFLLYSLRQSTNMVTLDLHDPQIRIEDYSPPETTLEAFSFAISKDGDEGVVSELNDLEKSDLLCGLHWAPHENQKPLLYIEGHRYERLRHCTPSVNFRTGSLSERSLSSWLRQQVRPWPRFNSKYSLMRPG